MFNVIIITFFPFIVNFMDKMIAYSGDTFV